MATASAEVGTVFVDQFAATFQSPFDGVFQLIAVIVSSPLVAAGFRGAGPVRQFLRSGPGTHGPGELRCERRQGVSRTCGFEPLFRANRQCVPRIWRGPTVYERRRIANSPGPFEGGPSMAVGRVQSAADNEFAATGQRF